MAFFLFMNSNVISKHGQNNISNLVLLRHPFSKVKKLYKYIISFTELFEQNFNDGVKPPCKKMAAVHLPQHLGNFIKPRDYHMLSLDTTQKQKKRAAYAMFAPVLEKLLCTLCLKMLKLF